MIYVHYNSETGEIISACDESCFKENQVLKKRDPENYKPRVPEEPYIKVTTEEWQSVPGRKVTRKVVAGKLVVTDKLSVADYDRIMEQYIKEACVSRGYTLREPDVYKDSSVPRWRQDARDFIAFRDACLLYGQSVINTYSQTSQVPTLDQFKAALVSNCPCVWTYSDIVTHEQVVEFLYQQKCRIAYGGVTITTPNGSFKFQTSIDSATMCSCQLHALQEQDDSYVVYWKVWQDGVPSVLPLAKPDFKRVFSFSRNMINTAFGVQGMLNSQAVQFTYEQLQNTQFMQTFYQAAIARFDAINTELEL